MNAENPNVGQPVVYTDRDQLNLSFPVTKQPVVPKKSKAELKREADELFDNFRQVLYGRDVDVNHKQRTIATLLDNYKSGTSDIATRSKSLLIDLFTSFLVGL